MYNTEHDPRFEVHNVTGEDLLDLGLTEDHKDEAISPFLDYVIVVRKTTENSTIVPVKDYTDHVIQRFWVETVCSGGLLEFTQKGLAKGDYSSAHEILEKCDSVLDLLVRNEWWDLAVSFRDDIRETKDFYEIKD